MTTDTRLPDSISRSASIAAAAGGLVLLTGPMFAGKSAALIAHARAARGEIAPAGQGPDDGVSSDDSGPVGATPNLDTPTGDAGCGVASGLSRPASGAGRGVLVLKPAFDVRDGVAVLCSRDGSRIEALPVSCWPGLADTCDVVVIDEVQFMVAPHYAGDIVADVLAAVQAGQQVIAGGLDTDYARQPFEPVARLAGHACRHVRLLARCHVCDAPAAWTAKREETGRRLELGLEGLYEARCDAHWSLPAASQTIASPAAGQRAATVNGVVS